ncbi:unnamed protein product [Zymoseptoria tritici ST99CH_1A5]|uniref:Uncharacterized protein n=1 Tax=Zymoseptoria tritici ST99CH_1A5 TaxID=1276529 RepID=A0A1Y6LQD4_ZYMTR|nr:unnamed protein product [Zymoseptoria tritici ST99CH_1A5]
MRFELFQKQRFASAVESVVRLVGEWQKSDAEYGVTMVVAAEDLLRSMNSRFVDLGPTDLRYQKLALAIERLRIHWNHAAFFGKAQTILDHMTAAQDPKGLRCFEQVVYLGSSPVFNAVPLWTKPEGPTAEGLLRDPNLRLLELLQKARLTGGGDTDVSIHLIETALCERVHTLFPEIESPPSKIPDRHVSIDRPELRRLLSPLPPKRISKSSDKSVKNATGYVWEGCGKPDIMVHASPQGPGTKTLLDSGCTASCVAKVWFVKHYLDATIRTLSKPLWSVDFSGHRTSCDEIATLILLIAVKDGKGREVLAEIEHEVRAASYCPRDVLIGWDIMTKGHIVVSGVECKAYFRSHGDVYARLV